MLGCFIGCPPGINLRSTPFCHIPLTLWHTPQSPWRKFSLFCSQHTGLQCISSKTAAISSTFLIACLEDVQSWENRNFLKPKSSQTSARGNIWSCLLVDDHRLFTRGLLTIYCPSVFGNNRDEKCMNSVFLFDAGKERQLSGMVFCFNFVSI